MFARSIRRVLTVGVLAVWLSQPVFAQPASPDGAPPPSGKEASAPEKPLPGPKYFNLRYDDDFSYLDGPPGSYKEDLFDPIKRIHLGDDLILSLGGELRFRLEAESNKSFDTNPRTQDTFQLYRSFVHFDFKYQDFVRVFFQGVAAWDEKRSLPKRGIDENRYDIHQLFLDVKPFGNDTNLTVRIGRQELQYGTERLVSPLDWANVRRRFDGVKVFWTDKDWRLDVWYVKPVVVKREELDDFDEQFDFWGAYFTFKGIPRHGIDVYFFATDRTGSRRNPNGKVGDESRFTLGSRFWGKTGPWDYEAELAGQWGRWAGHTIQAWSWTVDGGYTFKQVPWKPRLGAGFDWASGDEDPRDGKVGTFDQLFPLGHKYLGFLDLIGRQNITAVNVNLSAWPVEKKVKAAVAYHAFWLNADRDALYNAGGKPGRRDPFGNSGSEVGHEVDVTVVWKIDLHQALLLGYSHFWDSNFIINSGKSEDPDLFYVQYSFKF
ncbi:MAG: alginate export family protein [Phycisphaerae bacterium]